MCHSRLQFDWHFKQNNPPFFLRFRKRIGSRSNRSHVFGEKVNLTFYSPTSELHFFCWGFRQGAIRILGLSFFVHKHAGVVLHVTRFFFNLRLALQFFVVYPNLANSVFFEQDPHLSRVWSGNVAAAV